MLIKLTYYRYNFELMISAVHQLHEDERTVKSSHATLVLWDLTNKPYYNVNITKYQKIFISTELGGSNPT